MQLKQVHRVTCSACDQEIELADDAKPGDIITCCGVRHRLTFEFGAYALEPLAKA